MLTGIQAEFVAMVTCTAINKNNKKVKKMLVGQKLTDCKSKN